MWVVQRFRAGLWRMDEFHNTICPLGTSLSTHWQLNCSFHMPWGHWSAPSFELSVLLDQCEGLTFLLPWPSSRHHRRCPRKDLGSVTFLPCSCCLWLSCFPATLPAAWCLSVLWGYLHLSLQCQICDFVLPSFPYWSVIWAVITPLCSSGGLNEGEEGQTVF